MNRALRRRHLRAVARLEAEGRVATGVVVARTAGFDDPATSRNYLARLSRAGLLLPGGSGVRGGGYTLTDAGRHQLLVDEVVRAADDPDVSEEALRTALRVLAGEP